MITFKSYLTEQYGYTLFHATTVKRAVGIIASNQMNAHFDPMRDSGHQAHGVSFTRSLAYARKFAKKEFGDDEIVVFEVDGEKLRHNHKIVPVNSWYFPSQNIGNTRSKRNVEFEERLSGNIKDFDRFVRKVILFHKPGSAGFGHPILNHPKLFYNGKFVNK